LASAKVEPAELDVKSIACQHPTAASSIRMV
jgi:hypothetical protein